MNHLPPGQQLVAAGKWPIVGERSPRASEEEWTVTVRSGDNEIRTWTLDQLTVMASVKRIIDIHCVTRWSKIGMEFQGIPLLDLFDEIEIPPATRFVSFVARSDREHSTSIPWDNVRESAPLLVTHAEGLPLTWEHGGPIRVVVPGLYFYKSVKWLTRIDLLSEDRLGYWEQHAGYHNGADPWKEERFLAADLDPRAVRELMVTRDFRGRDLRGLTANGLDLSGLMANGAALRDARFQRANLRGASFLGTNLSGAHMQGADLRDARFGPDSQGRLADLEGADFCGADLRGTQFVHASLFGATFGIWHDSGMSTRFDASTRIDRTTWESLEATPEQQQILQGVTVFDGPE